MIELIYARAADLIETDGTTCFVGDPPDNVAVPFCFVWGPVPIEEPLTAGACDEVIDLHFHVQVVAKQAPDVLQLAGTVKRVLAGSELAVDGWKVFPIRVTGSEPVRTDRSAFNEASNTYPAWVTLHCRVQATKEHA